MGRLMPCDFTSIATAFESYQNNIRAMIVKGCAVEPLKHSNRFPLPARVETGTTESAGQTLIH